ncbi:MAG: PEGA domain-containing protein [Candidatus Atribacteria bacterium]|nr:PEGA domain-containing protein [Candidatus Atribacteria bacterium]
MKERTKKILIVAIIVVVFIAVFLIIRAISPSGGSIIINSYPEKASVYINDNLAGETPITIKNLDAGTYTVTVKLAGYKTYSEVVNLSGRNAKKTISIILEHSTFEIQVDSAPQGATVYLDGLLKGNTPLLISDVTTDVKHVLELKLENYSDYLQTINGQEGDTIQIFAQLEPVTTRIVINSTPSGADVYLNDKVVGKTPLDLKDIEEGEYKLKVVLPQYTPYEENITVEKGKTIKEDIALVKAQTFLSITSNPAGAKVFIDNIEKGITPYEDVNINVGTHKVRLELDGYLTYETDIVIEKNKPSNLNINLFKLP